MNAQTVLGFVKIASPDDEWTRKFTPDQIPSDCKADIFTFWQLYPDVIPHYNYRLWWDNIAILEISTYDDWWRKIKKETRNMVRKSQKCGVEVREIHAGDSKFADGVFKIHRESPVRRGRFFKAYNTPYEWFKRVYENIPPNDILLGAYLHDEVVGVLRAVIGETFGDIQTILGLMKHFDKAIMNALISGAVSVCSKRGIRYLAYMRMGDDDLSAFKRHNGFEKKLVPRYYVPLTILGKIVLKLGLHRFRFSFRGIREVISV